MKLTHHKYLHHKVHCSLISLWNTAQHLSTTLGGRFKIPNKKHKNVKNMALNRLKRTLVTSDHQLRQARHRFWAQPQGSASPTPTSPGTELPVHPTRRLGPGHQSCGLPTSTSIS